MFGQRKLVALCWMGSAVRDVSYVHLYPGMDIHVIVVVSNSIFLAGCTSVHGLCVNVYKCAVELLYCGHLGGPGKVSCIERCPHL